jgi:hypothetical protein
MHTAVYADAQTRNAFNLVKEMKRNPKKFSSGRELIWHIPCTYVRHPLLDHFESM